MAAAGVRRAAPGAVLRAGVLEVLGEDPSAADALTACGVPEVQRPTYVRALADLARSEMIEVAA